MLQNNRVIDALKRAVPFILGWGFTIYWLVFVLPGQHEFISGLLDLPVLAIIFLAGLLRRKFSGFLPAFVVLSYEIHAQSAIRVENFQIFYIFSWAVCVFLLYRQPERAGSLTLYHAGLSFDPGSAVTIGVGMQAGLSAAPVTILFLIFFIRELWNNRISFLVESRHFLAVAGLAWLAVNHYHGMASDLTAQFVAFAAAALLFFATCSEASDAREQQRHIDAIMAGGLLIIGAALANQLLESASLSEFFSRRAWAGSMHPNHLATWCLAMIWALVVANKAYPELHVNRRVFFVALYLLMILISGARLIMLTAVGGLALHYLLSLRKPVPQRENESESETVAPVGLLTRRNLLIITAFFLLVVFTGRFFYKFDPLELARNERLFIWKAAAGLIAQAPWTGHGVLQFALLPQQIDSASAVWVYDWNYPHTHQILLEMLLWGGIPLLVVFAISWLFALKFWYMAGMTIAILSVSATVLADFTWRTPAMILLAVFYLIPGRKPGSDNQNSSFALKTGFSLAMLLVIVWLTGMHSGFNSYNRSLQMLATGNDTWKSEIENAITRLPFSVDARMQRLLWHLSREKIDGEFISQLAELRQRFPAFWPALFLEARRAEIAGDFHTAFNLYQQTLLFEGVDLSGIRNARAAILAMQLNSDLLEGFAGATLARGQWGAAMLLNHPRFGNRFRTLATGLAARNEPHDFFSAVHLARSIKNLAMNGLVVDESIIRRLDPFVLPDWLLDEMIGAVSLAKAELIAKNYEKVDYSSTGRLKPRLLSPIDRNEIDMLAELLRQHGPACLRTLAWIRLEQADHGGFIAAYDQMLQKYNFRSKNNEDLSGQFLFARFAYLAGEYRQSVNMLQKLTAFDTGCPFVSKLWAQCCLALEKPDEAAYFLKLARQQAKYARLDPFYREEPRSLLWPQGDQWIFLFEKV
ncbi:MAG TPA: O-antigen ligase family protein, partial [Candidatus Rifleibacterium sp.]|nr:O-antigen ligase family protein [Candidatus Rifleibacterium sp.]